MEPYYRDQHVTLYHADCLDALRVLPAEHFHAVVTDPPYGLDFQSCRVQEKRKRVANDARPFIWWLRDAFRVTRPGGCLFSFHEWRGAEAFRIAIEAAGFTTRSQVVWDRQVHGLGSLHDTFAPQHDLAWFAIKGKFTFPNGRPKSVLRHPRVPHQQAVHPTQKPEPLMQEILAALLPPNGLVLDPFAGSGSTLFAAASLGFHAVGIELDEEYCEHIATRLGAGATLCCLTKPRPAASISRTPSDLRKKHAGT